MSRTLRNTPRPWRHGLLALAACVLAAGCGGGSGSSGGGNGIAANSTERGVTVVFQDATAPITISATGQPVFEMHELWMTVTGAALERNGGGLVPLTLTTQPLTVDLMTLDNSSVLLGWVGNFPAGSYKGLELTLQRAEIRGTDLLTGAQNVTATVQLSSLLFEAEFKPAHAWLDPASPTSVVVDWRPAVTAQRDPVTGAIRYELDDEVHAFVVGAPGNPTTYQPRTLRDLEGELTAIDCAAQTFTIVRHGLAISIDFDAQTRFVDDRDNPLPGGCGDLRLGDEVEVEGHLQAGNRILATKVEDKDLQLGGGGGHSGGQHGNDFERLGVADNVQTGSLPIFTLRVGSRPIAEVRTSAATDFEFDDHHPNYPNPVDPAQDIYDGVRLKVEGTISGTNAAGLPVVDADEVKIR